jgi:aspartate ammonia-lyase
MARRGPGAACYAIHALRALENFPISDLPMSNHRDPLRWLTEVKEAAANLTETTQAARQTGGDIHARALA